MLTQLLHSEANFRVLPVRVLDVDASSEVLGHGSREQQGFLKGSL